ncbi:MAG: DUF1761 domain-containing protein [Myxococcota bacterium]
MTPSMFIAAFVAALVSMFLGALWYSPLVFGGTWRRLVGLEHEPNPIAAYGGAFSLMLVGAVIFGAFIGPDPSLGLALGAGSSAGVAWAAGSLWISYLFEARSVTLGLINGGYHIAQYTIVGLVFWAI